MIFNLIENIYNNQQHQFFFSFSDFSSNETILLVSTFFFFGFFSNSEAIFVVKLKNDSSTCSDVFADISKNNMFFDLANSAAFYVDTVCYFLKSDLFPSLKIKIPIKTSWVSGSTQLSTSSSQNFSIDSKVSWLVIS